MLRTAFLRFSRLMHACRQYDAGHDTDLQLLLQNRVTAENGEAEHSGLQKRTRRSEMTVSGKSPWCMYLTNWPPKMSPALRY